MEDNNNSNNTSPSSSSDKMPSGGGIKQGAKNTVRKGWNSIKDAAGRGIRAIWKALPLKAKLIVLAVVVILILIIAAAWFIIGVVGQGTKVTTQNVDSYISSSENISKEAKELYEDKSSLIKLKLSDVDGIYQKFVSDGNGGEETQRIMKYEIGTNEVKDDSKEKRIVNIDDKLPLYKHILLAEKYNFNNIKWQKFSHNATAGKEVKDGIEDKELGLRYPDDRKFESGADNPSPMKLEKFIDMTLPYLQTWYIPLSMANASVVSGTQEDSDRAPNFSYNIIKEAYHNLIVNWYELKTHTTVTKYYTYDLVKKQDTVTGVDVIERIYKNGDRSYSLSLGDMDVSTTENSRDKMDTSTINGRADSTKEPMKEELVRESDEYKSNFYIKEADVFDAKIINQFNYQVYNDADAKQRKNPKSSSETTATWTKVTSDDGSENKSTNAVSRMSVGSDDGQIYIGGANYTVFEQGGAPVEMSLYDPTGQVQSTLKHSYEIKLGEYIEYENGLEHTVTRVWKDTLEQKSSETSDYTVDDLVAYNQSKDRKEPVSGADLCGEGYTSSGGSGTSFDVSGTGNASMASVAKALVDRIGNHKVEYGSPRDAGNGFSSWCYVCCTFVSEVVYNVTNHKYNFADYNTVDVQGEQFYKHSDDFQLIYYHAGVTGTSPDFSGNVNTDKRLQDILQPGDIVATYSNEATFQHIMIYVGNGEFANMADTPNAVCIQNRGFEFNCKYVFRLKGGNSSNTSSSNSSSNPTNPSNTSSNSSTPQQGTGQSSETPSDVNSTGYTSIFTSGTTGRKFKNFKQNGNSYLNSYPIAGSYWGQECGSVSVIICGSGYSDKSNIADVASKLNNSGTMFIPWLQEYSGANVKEVDNPSQAQLVKLLQDGCVGVVHYPAYSARGHYLAVLDVKPDGSQIYVSNPDMNDNIPNGWNPASVFFSNGTSLTDCYFVPNEGNVADYSGLSDASGNGAEMSCTGTSSGKYYTSLRKTDGLNRIDFMNSNPDIFHRYIREGGEYLPYVGYARSKLTLSYWNLKNLFNEVYEKNGGSLPWAYGKTLGFENIYGVSNSKKTAGGGRFIWPVPEYVEAGVDMWHQLTSTFGSRTNPFDPSQGQQNHNGIDISHSTNTSAKIVAAASGEVILVVDNIPGKTDYASYGNHVIIKHSDGYYTLYGHMAPGSLLVKVGDKVNAGQQIGTMGTTGSSTGNHLHFEISKIEGNISPSEYYSSTRLDPCDFFNEDCSPIGGGTNNGPSGIELSVEETKDFARMIYGEAGGNSYELQVACAAAAINQYKAAKAEGKNVNFLDDFIHDTHNFNGYDASFTINEGDSSYKAAVDALNGEDPTGGALYFYAPAAMEPPGPSEWHESLTYLCTIDGVRFFKP